MNLVAEKTLHAIEQQIKSDNGAEFKKHEQELLPLMHDAYKADKKDGLRDHLGASIVGDDCPRRIWLNFRGCGQSDIDARMIRLFNRGHLEEARFIALLQMINVKVHYQDADLKQYSFSKLGAIFGVVAME